jgi:hypothetical protein
MLIGMTASSSKGSREQPNCMCHRSCTIDVWEWDDTNKSGRHYFKCVDTDSDFMLWW